MVKINIIVNIKIGKSILYVTIVDIEILKILKLIHVHSSTLSLFTHICLKADAS